MTGRHNLAVRVSTDRVDQLARMDADGALAGWARQVLVGDDGLLNAQVYERLLPDLSSPKLDRLADRLRQHRNRVDRWRPKTPQDRPAADGHRNRG